MVFTMEKETLRFDETTFFTKQSDSNGIGNIPQLATAIRSSDKNIQIPALKSLLNIVVNVPESVEALYENDVVSVLNKYIGGAQEGEIYVLSSTILHVIGVRSKVEDASVRAGAATESLIRIIHSSNEKESKSGSKALCELVEENSQIRNSLLSTGFAQVVLHTLTSNTQIETKSSSSSSSSPENPTPIFIKIGLLNVILKLSEEEKGLESLIVLIPVLEELKLNGENQLKSKAKNLLLILSQIKGINSQNSNSNSNSKEKDQKIQQMEESNKCKDEELRIKDQELLKMKNERDKEKQRAEQAEQRKEEEIKLLKAENDSLKKDIEKLKTKQGIQQKESNPIQDYPIQIINNDPPEIIFSDVDGAMKKISKKNNNNTSVSLTQILENGIWQMEAEFSNSDNVAAIGIVRDTYNIPAKAHPCDTPHCQHMVSYGMSGFRFGDGAVYYKENGTEGNIAYKDNQKIKAEYDSEKGTVIFSVDGVQQPVYVRGINEKVRFIIYICYPQASCTIRSLKKLIAPTTKHVANEIAVQW
ncbi:MAG: hypothetical protein EZS28_026935 [Streblomastix strix]|uniref:B30.2/SPRY domain-containing protein n=1 Tax=Streblomastix strix TaxID=222440 RepID=A0A5J4V4K6_9EUKA|nr:MAG: hypothetical protein EZS28_026935 [Streblomastix strix]